MLPTKVLPNGLVHVDTEEVGPRPVVNIATWIDGPNITLWTLPNFSVLNTGQLGESLKLNADPRSKLIAFWEIEVEVERILSPGDVGVLRRRLIGNVTILKLSEYMVMYHSTMPGMTILKLTGFGFPLRAQFLQLDSTTVLQLPERYTVMLTTGAER